MTLHDTRAILSKDSFHHENEFHVFPRLNDTSYYENKLQLFMVARSLTSAEYATW